MYSFDTTKRFDKALKLCKKRGYPIDKLRNAIKILLETGSLPKDDITLSFNKLIKGEKQ